MPQHEKKSSSASSSSILRDNKPVEDKKTGTAKFVGSDFSPTKQNESTQDNKPNHDNKPVLRRSVGCDFDSCLNDIAAGYLTSDKNKQALLAVMLLASNSAIQDAKRTAVAMSQNPEQYDYDIHQSFLINLKNIIQHEARSRTLQNFHIVTRMQAVIRFVEKQFSKLSNGNAQAELFCASLRANEVLDFRMSSPLPDYLEEIWALIDDDVKRKLKQFKAVGDMDAKQAQKVRPNPLLAATLLQNLAARLNLSYDSKRFVANNIDLTFKQDQDSLSFVNIFGEPTTFTGMPKEPIAEGNNKHKLHASVHLKLRLIYDKLMRMAKKYPNDPIELTFIDDDCHSNDKGRGYFFVFEQYLTKKIESMPRLQNVCLRFVKLDPYEYVVKCKDTAIYWKAGSTIQGPNYAKACKEAGVSPTPIFASLSPAGDAKPLTNAKVTNAFNLELRQAKEALQKSKREQEQQLISSPTQPYDDTCTCATTPACTMM